MGRPNVGIYFEQILDPVKSPRSFFSSLISVEVFLIIGGRALYKREHLRQYNDFRVLDFFVIQLKIIRVDISMRY